MGFIKNLIIERKYFKGVLVKDITKVYVLLHILGDQMIYLIFLLVLVILGHSI